ncbi:MAG TPA: SPOR domain-containing protein [Vicinamibacterales bacterium]|nr:SPOR domain-containing protein [Vicinamibacterales bacterium]
MPELSHDTTEDGFHEIQLSGKQLVFLFIVTTSVVVGVFLFGVLVGRGARDVRQDETPSATTSAAPTPAPSAAPDPSATEAPAPAGDEPEKPDALSYADRLTKSSPATESLKPKGDDKPKNEEPRMPPAAAAAPPTAAVPPKEPVVKPQPPAAAPTPVRTAGDSNAPTAGKPGTWLVQVIATRESAVANSVVKRLASKGYPAFLVNPVPGAPQPFYKVQVGRYSDRSEAEQVSQRIKKEEQFQSWILR